MHAAKKTEGLADRRIMVRPPLEVGCLCARSTATFMTFIMFILPHLICRVVAEHMNIMNIMNVVRGYGRRLKTVPLVERG